MENTPQYQRLVQKMMRYSPHQQAVLKTTLEDKEFANEHSKKMLTLAQMGAQKEFRNRALALQAEKTEYGKEQISTANALNLLGVGVATKTALDTSKMAGKKAGLIRTIAEGYK